MSARKRIVVIGAGGQARDIAWLIEEINRSEARYDLVGFVVTDLAKLGEYDSRDRVLGDYSWLERHPGAFDCLALGIGTPTSRLRVAADLSERIPNTEWPSLVHPGALFQRDSAKIGRGAQVCAGVVGTVNLVIADYSLINLGSTLGHEAEIGRGSVVLHAASISGGVRLGEGVLVGSGARILQYLSVGARATVGAGAIVTRDVAPGETVVGVPARPMSRGVSPVASEVAS